MVSYYNPAAVAMFSRTGSAHHHHPHHHSSPTQNHYFGPAYSSYHPHHHHHHQPAPPTPVGVGVGVSSAQFSPNMPTDFNCNHQYHHQFGNVTPDSMAAAASWHQPMYSACAARNMVHTAATGYEDWSHQHSHVPPTTTTTHPSFYPHQQPSPPSSTPSPNSTHTGGHHSPNVYTSATTNHSNSFKTEFGPCSGGNPQENSSQEMQTQGPVVSSAGASISIGTPHSPDSGMAISDGVSSSGSPATGQAQNPQQQQQHCLGAASHHHLGSTVPSLNGAMLQGSQATNLNNLSQQQSLHTGRPAQARSPYEWMKKPTYSAGSNSGGECRKTRTKDKYRVVYSDTQRLELEKEFHYSRYITIRRKAELASILGLSERQVKIWFQNRRAKERKVVRKREEMIHREKIATMVHMQNAAVAAAAGGMASVSGGPMCNQPNGNSVSLPQLM